MLTWTSNIFIGVFFVITMNSFVFAASHCDALDRKYSCDCSFGSSNQTVHVEEQNKYNASVDNFMPAIKSLQYCRGSLQCKPNFLPTSTSDKLSTDSYIVCFSDDSCLSYGGVDVAPLGDFHNNICIENSCMHPKNLIEFNITNGLLEVSTYKCFIVGPKGLQAPYCLKPACKSFVAIEKLCVCNYDVRNCRCSSYCQNLLTSPSHKTYALFLSFGDIYTTRNNKGSFLHWIILIILCFGLSILLIIFCRLCKVSVNPSCGNEVQSAEILRRILTTDATFNAPSSSATTKNEFCSPERNSPPPSYEQVLKDKCIEFKKSVAC